MQIFFFKDANDISWVHNLRLQKTKSYVAQNLVAKDIFQANELEYNPESSHSHDKSDY